MKQWTTQANYDRKRLYYADYKKNPEILNLEAKDFELKTVPDQAISVTELMQRHAQGRPQPQE
jgi:hypothetical protein